MKTVHIPLRTCISCGAKKAKRELIRLVVNAEGEVVRDPNGRGSGRGAYVCNNKTCISHPKLKHYLKRAFRTNALTFKAKAD
jgi:predicted RNA-binding protein YlxR (DUF448 family)